MGVAIQTLGEGLCAEKFPMPLSQFCQNLGNSLHITGAGVVTWSHQQI